ncbi:DUF3888 domain-containing protein [Neobacillus sp. OS1-2]|uniref:DUF3888 domain-containing protein n=1 Tax=Neobacillus sp. OS1-2 TaxID=3070680 RepID=UPI0027E05352|nr:DUF3888 domain-containing protein [Neobacillus sp. OS1-2]WML39626.1 DUF3888 domain-containing protein [Neobacillus sp. OS1-2]
MNIRKFLIIFFIVALILTNQPILSSAQIQNKNFCETVKFALIASLMPTINQTLEKIYKRPTQWAGAGTEVLNIKQLYGIGGAYRVKLRVHTYEGAHNPPYGVDTITIEVGPDGPKVINYIHKEEKVE